VSTRIDTPEVRSHLWRRAGLLSRLGADLVDLVAVVLIGWILLVIGGGIRGLWTHDVKVIAPSQPTREILAALLLFAYLAYGYGLNGRTLGKLLMGLRVVNDSGRDLSPVKGILRAALCLVFIPGILWAAVSGRNASLQDLALRTSVVYDWGLGPAPPHPGGA
jgi:uncharacterized RDD family membrane protein YckC